MLPGVGVASTIGALSLAARAMMMKTQYLCTDFVLAILLVLKANKRGVNKVAQTESSAHRCDSQGEAMSR